MMNSWLLISVLQNYPKMSPGYSWCPSCCTWFHRSGRSNDFEKEPKCSWIQSKSTKVAVFQQPKRKSFKRRRTTTWHGISPCHYHFTIRQPDWSASNKSYKSLAVFCRDEGVNDTLWNASSIRNSLLKSIHGRTRTNQTNLWRYLVRWSQLWKSYI